MPALHRSIGFLTILFSLQAASFAGALEASVGLAASTDSVHGVIREAYLDVLCREPDEAGLRTYTEYMVGAGKDEVWLRDALRNSEEGQKRRARARARATRVGVALASVFCATLVAIVFRGRLRRLCDVLWSRLSRPRQQYLAEAASLSPVAAVLAFLCFYANFKAGSPLGWILCGFVVLAAIVAARTPRWICYIALCCGIVAFVAWGVFVDANGGQDGGSDRDDAVEIAATAFVHGNNPWSQKSILNLPITTGPSSILMAVPFVSVFGKINPLTFLMWCAFVAILAVADIRGRNNTFFTAALLLFFPWFGFLHTLHWSLDELYYAAILSPLFALALTRGRLGLAGALGGFMALSRLSYAPAVFAAGLWWFLKDRRSLRSVLCVALGGAAYSVAVIGLFWMVGGDDFLVNNFWKNSQVEALRNGSNLVTFILTRLLGVLPGGTLGSAIVVLFLTALASLALRRLEHPFFHLAVGSLLAHTIAFSPRFPMDYQLTFLVPALYGLCFSSRGHGEGTDPAKSSGRLNKQGPASGRGTAFRGRT